VKLPDIADAVRLAMPDPNESPAATVARLAVLPLLECDIALKPEAKRLGLTMAELKAAVKAERARQSRASGQGSPESPPDARGRPDLEVIQADLPDTAAALGKLLAERPMLFDRGGPARLTVDERQGGAKAELLTVHGVVNECHAVARPFERQATPDGSERRRYMTLPDRVAKLYLDRPEGLRPLDGIASAPLLTEDGGIRTADGYDPETKLWCERMPCVEVPERPAQSDAAAALLLLRQWSHTFCFADAPKVYDPTLGVNVVDISKRPGEDESAALAGLMTAICRPSLWLAPGLMVGAPALSGAGTGKGLLCHVICALAFGQPPQAMTGGGNPEELEKRIAAALIRAEPTLFLDNLNNYILKSDLLASVLTERPCKVRPLGTSNIVRLNAATMVLVTGNGVALSEDLARRFLVVELDAGTEDPEQRPFPGGFDAETLARRAELLQAALTIWRWGRLNSSSLTKGKPIGSFTQWGEWVRDPLLTLGCRDPVDRIAEIKANDPKRRATAELFNVWWTAHGRSRVTVKELADGVRDVADPQGRGRQFLASTIRKLEGTRTAGFVLVRHAPAGKWTADRYQLSPTDEPKGGENIGDHRGASGSAPAQTPMTPMPPDDLEVDAIAGDQPNARWRGAL
jgi:hypothetical protein